jgi:NTP pyrophosphatase (non-canonical NTP hydrolase)
MVIKISVKKSVDMTAAIEDEIADVMWVLICLSTKCK